MKTWNCFIWHYSRPCRCFDGRQGYIYNNDKVRYIAVWESELSSCLQRNQDRALRQKTPEQHCGLTANGKSFRMRHMYLISSQEAVRVNFWAAQLITHLSCQPWKLKLKLGWRGLSSRTHRKFYLVFSSIKESLYRTREKIKEIFLWF